jgi:hypothetical protein
LALILATLSMRLLAEEPVYKDAATGLSFPKELAGLKFVERSDWESQPDLNDPAPTTELFYLGTGAGLRFWITEPPKDDVPPDGVEATFIKREVLKDYFKYRNRPNISGAKKNDFETILEDTPVPFMRLTGTYDLRVKGETGAVVFEHYATVFRQRYIRIAASYYTLNSEYARKEIDAAVKALSSWIIEARSGATKPADVSPKPQDASTKPGGTSESPADSVGTATMRDNGTIVVQLRAVTTGGDLGDGRLIYPPTHREYEKILQQIGPIKKGETIRLKSWPVQK